MGIDISGLGAVADLASGVINRFFPDKTEQEKAQIAQALTIMQMQMDVNKEEAKSTSVFVSGWRPFIGWVCGMACAWNWLGLPMAVALSTYMGHPIPLSSADITEMMPVLMGMLGLGGLRTYEKLNGVASK